MVKVLLMELVELSNKQYGQLAVRSAEAFASIAQERCNSIKMFYISVLQITQHQDVLNQMWNAVVQ
jgi:hypothetical protein